MNFFFSSYPDILLFGHVHRKIMPNVSGKVNNHCTYSFFFYYYLIYDLFLSKQLITSEATFLNVFKRYSHVLD